MARGEESGGKDRQRHGSGATEYPQWSAGPHLCWICDGSHAHVPDSRALEGPKAACESQLVSATATVHGTCSDPTRSRWIAVPVIPRIQSARTMEMTIQSWVCQLLPNFRGLRCGMVDLATFRTNLGGRPSAVDSDVLWRSVPFLASTAPIPPGRGVSAGQPQMAWL